MTSLAELRAELLPAARPVWPETGAATGKAARPIAWVRVMKARVPAFDALEPGDLAIVPAPALAVIAQGSDTVASLTDAFLAPGRGRARCGDARA